MANIERLFEARLTRRGMMDVISGGTLALMANAALKAARAGDASDNARTKAQDLKIQPANYGYNIHYQSIGGIFVSGITLDKAPETPTPTPPTPEETNKTKEDIDGFLQKGDEKEAEYWNKTSQTYLWGVVTLLIGGVRQLMPPSKR